jgi:hypothetical protein
MVNKGVCLYKSLIKASLKAIIILVHFLETSEISLYIKAYFCCLKKGLPITSWVFPPPNKIKSVKFIADSKMSLLANFESDVHFLYF